METLDKAIKNLEKDSEPMYYELEERERSASLSRAEIDDICSLRVVGNHAYFFVIYR